jgi:hypothetical protein
MKRIIKYKKGLTIFTILFAIAIIATININLASIGSFSPSLTLENLEAMTEETVTAEYHILYNIVLEAKIPIYCKKDIADLTDLNKGCQTHNFDSIIEDDITTRYYYCMRGKNYGCNSGMEMYSKGKRQPGSTVIRYTCKK